MPTRQNVIRVYEAGKLTVLGFGDAETLDRINLAEFRDELASLVKQHNCEVLAFDLTGVKLIPSGLLGLLTSLRDLGVEVHLYNPSPDVREVLEITRLDKLMPIHEIDVA